MKVIYSTSGRQRKKSIKSFSIYCKQEECFINVHRMQTNEFDLLMYLLVKLLGVTRSFELKIKMTNIFFEMWRYFRSLKMQTFIFYHFNYNDALFNYLRNFQQLENFKYFCQNSSLRWVTIIIHWSIQNSFPIFLFWFIVFAKIFDWVKRFAIFLKRKAQIGWFCPSFEVEERHRTVKHWAHLMLSLCYSPSNSYF